MYDQVKKAFSKQSEIFDEYEEGNEILKWMRSVTRRHVQRYLKNGDSLLELNAGTGLDAVYFAKSGYKIHCTDISEGMLSQLSKKIQENNLSDLISFQNLSFDQLNKLNQKSFDYIFSNFGGLNCAKDLKDVFKYFPNLLNPGGKVTLVTMPVISPWEIILALKGNIKTAFRRFHKKGVEANVEGIKFRTYYFSVGKVIKALGKNFKILEIQGLGSVSPPPFMENFPRKLPGIYKSLTKLDEKFSQSFPFNRWADHFILTAEYRP